MQKRISIAAVCVIILSIAAWGIWRATTSDKQSQDNTTVQTFTGTIACLPKPGDGPHTMECAIGLKAGQKYYALKNNPRHNLPTETPVKVSGKVVPPSGSEMYDIAGTIEVTSIETTQ
jgi:hypothetical protein